jgi:hypothetical protein
MRSLIIAIAALLIALPVRAYNAGCSTASDGSRTCWRGNISVTRSPNGDWSRRDWSRSGIWSRPLRSHPPRRHAHRHSSKSHERVIKREIESLRYERVIKESR